MSNIDYQARHLEQEKQRRANMKRRRAAILEHARTLDLTEIQITYDGGGDEGNIQDIWGHRDGTRGDEGPDRDSEPTNAVDLTTTGPITVGNETFLSLNGLVEAFGWDVLNLHHGGFEINDGGFGNIFINVATSKVKLEKNEHFTDTTYSEEEV
jgi:hypothetical protein